MTEEKDWDKRPPARMTIEMIKGQNDKICSLESADHKFELTIQGMGDKLEAIKTSLDEHKIQQKEDFNGLKAQQKEDFTQLKKTMQNFIDAADDKFAPILVYRIMVWAGGIAGAAVIVGLLTLIFRVIINLNK